MTEHDKDLKTGTAVPACSGGLFDGFFARENTRTYSKDSFIDNRARRLFEMTASACEADVYPYQLPLESRSGPWVEAEGHRMLMLSSYDYLGLIGEPSIDAAAVDAIHKYGTGTGGVRLLTGSLDLHRKLEADLARFKGTDAAVTFTSGYSANLAAVSALLMPQDRAILDTLAHRSLVDACRLAGVQVQRFRHNDMDSLRHEIKNGPQANRTLIITDGVFSMDGDVCLLPELVAVKKELGCFLMVDESHSTGVLGKHGRGTDEHFGMDASEVDIWTGSLGKAIPASGGFVAVSQELGIYLQHAAALYIFSAALCPPAAAATRATIALLEKHPERVATLDANAVFLREGLREMGYDVGASTTPIIPVVLHEEKLAACMSAQLRQLGVLTSPIMFPAVAQGSARLRLCATAAHTREDLEFALDAFRKLRP